MWRFSYAVFSQKIGKIQKRTLRLLYNDSYSSYNSLLLKAEWSTMEVSRMWRLAIELFKTSNSLNLDFIYTYLKKGSQSVRRRNDLVVNKAKTTTFDEKSLWTLGPKIWNSLHEDVKGLTFLQNLQSSFKHSTDLNTNATSANTPTANITIFKLHTLA